MRRAVARAHGGVTSDARWKVLGPGLESGATRGSILESASRLVKEGGRLVYATCSPARRE